jgi:hypothetical protein
MRIASFMAVALTIGGVALFACVGDDPAVSPATGPDADASADVDAACPKLCGSNCVSLMDPLTGCSGSSCEPCPTSPHRPAVCNTDTACAVGSCDPGYLDCDDTQPGCETNGSTDSKNCGHCGAECGKLHTSSVACVTGKCDYK